MKNRLLLRARAVCLATFAISLLTPATLLAALITNPSFEVDGYVDLWSSNATGWIDNVGSAKFSGVITDTNFHTDGSHGVALSTSATSGYGQSYVYLSQSVDLTGVSSVMFDAKLSVLEAHAWESKFEADFYIDSTKKWSQQSIGTYLNQSFDVSSLSGMHTIEFRLQANLQGLAGYTNRYEFDNVRLISAPEPSGVVFFSTASVVLLSCVCWRKLRQMLIRR
jgi:hypothetical protein